MGQSEVHSMRVQLIGRKLSGTRWPIKGRDWIMPFSSFPYFNQISDRFVRLTVSGRQARASGPLFAHKVAIFHAWKSFSIASSSIRSFIHCPTGFSSSIEVAHRSKGRDSEAASKMGRSYSRLPFPVEGMGVAHLQRRSECLRPWLLLG